MALYVAELENIILLKRDIADNDKKVIDCFINAINDWPNHTLSFEEYELEVHNFIKEVPNKHNLETSLKKINLSKINAWQAESIAGLLDVYQFYNDELCLKEIINDLKIKLGIKEF